MPEFVGFQIMGILVPYGIIFDAVGIFGLAFHILFKSCSTYCGAVKVWVFWEGHKIWKNLRRTFDKSVVFCARNSLSTCQKVDEDFFF